MHDVIVVGGGIGGCGVAALLAKKGFNVVLVEPGKYADMIMMPLPTGSESWETVLEADGKAAPLAVLVGGKCVAGRRPDLLPT